MKDIDQGELGRVLLEIQKLDTEILGLRRDIEGLADTHKLAELRKRLEEAEKALAGAEEDLEERKHGQHKLDGELDILSTKIKKEEEKLFSGTVMNPKELSAIQSEILSLRKKSDEMETEDLEMMEIIDRARLEVEETGRFAEEVSSEERNASREYEQELIRKEKQLVELEKKRDALKLGVEDEEILALYENLLETKGGLAVAVIENGKNCGGCHVEFSRSQIDRFQHDEGIFRCEYCRRILVK